jgi:hypothetical protein
MHSGRKIRRSSRSKQAPAKESALSRYARPTLRGAAVPGWDGSGPDHIRTTRHLSASQVDHTACVFLHSLRTHHLEWDPSGLTDGATPEPATEISARITRGTVHACRLSLAADS